MNRRALISLFGLYALRASAERAGDNPGLSAKELSLFTPISDGISSAANCLLYEGLPHPISDGEQFSKALATKETIRLHEYPFYKGLLPVAAEDVVTLRRLSTAGDSYWGDRGPKQCLPFHPDYCILWLGDKATYEQLICFGCQEMRLYGPERAISLDIRTSTATQFAITLKGYRKERPAPSRGWHN